MATAEESERQIHKPEGTRRPQPRAGRATLPYLYVAPAFILLAVLVFYPLILSLYFSLHVDNLLLPGEHFFVGLANYAAVLHDPAFLQAAGNTVEYFFIASLGVLLLGLPMAFWFHAIRRGRGFFLALLMLPWAIPGTVTGLLWSFIYNPVSGLLNAMLRTFNLIPHYIVWLNGSASSRLFVGVSLLWQVLPLTVIIFLAGLESIPANLYEAAAVDGCTGWQAVRRITIPLLRPALAIGLVEAGVLGIGVFDQIYVLTGYAPATKSAVIQTYLYAFQNLNFGQGISAAMFVTVVTLLVSVFYLRVVYREVSY
ncbi:MAG: sugar ABC transporter permease [Firmicutes bacterium]|jgi:ABC-type sugar transport system permease subunit|nr:sugar ABC transporter permease [Bacillota bacterium]